MVLRHPWIQQTSGSTAHETMPPHGDLEVHRSKDIKKGPLQRTSFDLHKINVCSPSSLQKISKPQNRKKLSSIIIHRLSLFIYLSMAESQDHKWCNYLWCISAMIRIDKSIHRFLVLSLAPGILCGQILQPCLPATTTSS